MLGFFMFMSWIRAEEADGVCSGLVRRFAACGNAGSSPSVILQNAYIVEDGFEVDCVNIVVVDFAHNLTDVC